MGGDRRAVAGMRAGSLRRERIERREQARVTAIEHERAGLGGSREDLMQQRSQGSRQIAVHRHGGDSIVSQRPQPEVRRPRNENNLARSAPHEEADPRNPRPAKKEIREIRVP